MISEQIKISKFISLKLPDFRNKWSLLLGKAIFRKLCASKNDTERSRRNILGPNFQKHLLFHFKDLWVLATRILVPRSWYQDLGTKILVPGSWYQDLGTKIMVPRSWYQDLVPRSWQGQTWHGTEIFGTAGIIRARHGNIWHSTDPPDHGTAWQGTSLLKWCI